MNIEAILALADLIEVQPHVNNTMANAGFGMDNYKHHCGTPMCIAGFAAMHSVANNTGQVAKAKLGFSEVIARELFIPSILDFDWNSITPAVAAKCLRNLATTGKVDWDKAGAARRKVVR